MKRAVPKYVHIDPFVLRYGKGQFSLASVQDLHVPSNRCVLGAVYGLTRERSVSLRSDLSAKSVMRRACVVAEKEKSSVIRDDNFRTWLKNFKSMLVH
jgi:hypothetical protein